MDADTNPYRSPEPAVDRYSAAESMAGGIDRFAFVAWPVVFAINTIVPSMFAWTMIGRQAWIGVAMAAPMLLTFGWAMCCAHAMIARRLIYGGAIVAVTQLVPILQIVAGLASLGVVNLLRVSDGAHQLTAVSTGFVMTFIVGCILLACAGAIGWSCTALVGV